MDYGLIGSIIPWAGTWEPLDWQFCAGQTVLIQQYPALYSIIGTLYGGDGQTTFKLPNLQKKFPIGVGAGNLLTVNYAATGGTATGQMTAVPYHNHAFSGTVTASLAVSSVNGDLPGPSSANAPGVMVRRINPTLTATVAEHTNNATGTLSDIGLLAVTAPTVPAVTGSTGAATVTAFSTQPPYQTLNYLICMNGFYPTRP